MRLLDFLKIEHSSNETREFAENEGICKKDTLYFWLTEFLDEKRRWISKREEGQKVYYKTTPNGLKEIEEWKRFMQGEKGYVIPITPMEMTFSFGPEPYGIVASALWKQLRDSVMNDPVKSKAIGTLIGSFFHAYAESLTDNETTFQADFTEDGRLALTVIYSRDESLQFRKMINSGHFEENSEQKHLAYLGHHRGLSQQAFQFVGEKHPECREDV